MADSPAPEQLEGIGQQFAAMLEYLDLPEEFKASLVAIIPDLEAEQFELLYNSLYESVVDRIAVETSEEYIAEADEIDKQTMAEIDEIINEEQQD